jgi:hypothetical protein
VLVVESLTENVYGMSSLALQVLRGQNISPVHI